MRRSLKGVLSKVNQLAERAQSVSGGDILSGVAPRLEAARRRLAAGLTVEKPSWWSVNDDELRQRNRFGEAGRIAERLIAARRRMLERG